jgi:type VI secretion system secreted protein Hcp
MPESKVSAAYLKIDSIKGESIAKNHTDEIEIESYWFQAQHGTTAGHGSGQGTAGAAGISDLKLIKRTDNSTPQLFQALVNGQDLKKISLAATKVGAGSQQGFYTVTLTGAKVTSFQTKSSVAQYGDFDPRDECSLSFTKLELVYRKQNPDGSLGPESKAIWSVETLSAD